MGKDSSGGDNKGIRWARRVIIFCAYSTFLFVNPYIIVSLWFGKIYHLKSAYKMCFLLFLFIAYH